MAAPWRTSGMASWPAPHTTSRIGGRATSTKARTTRAPVPVSSTIREAPMARPSAAAARASASIAGARLPEIVPSAPISRREPGWTCAGSDDSTMVTRAADRFSSIAARSVAAVSIAMAAGSTKTSIAPLQPRP